MDSAVYQRWLILWFIYMYISWSIGFDAERIWYLVIWSTDRNSIVDLYAMTFQKRPSYERQDFLKNFHFTSFFEIDSTAKIDLEEYPEAPF